MDDLFQRYFYHPQLLMKADIKQQVQFQDYFIKYLDWGPTKGS